MQHDDIDQAMALIRPFFDPTAYAFEYTDVTGDAEQLLQHFCSHGWKEGRNPNRGFDVTFYLERNPDVAAVNWNPYLHYIFIGYRENRRTTPACMPRRVCFELLGRDAGGWVELMQPSFDVEYYKSQFRQKLGDQLNPIAHFAFRGWRDALNPNAKFNMLDAVKINTELFINRVNPFLYEVVKTGQ